MSESIEWFIENQAFSPSCDIGSSPPPSLPSCRAVSLSQSFCVSPVELTDGRRGWERSPIGRRQECLALYKSFSTGTLSLMLFGTCIRYNCVFFLFQELLDGEHARSKAPQHRFRYRPPVFLLSCVLLVTSDDPARISYEKPGSGCGTTVHWLSHLLISN